MNFYKRSFTLIELLIVIAILGILMTAMIIGLNPAQATKKTRDLKRIKDIESIYNTLLEYDQSTGGSLPLAGSTNIRPLTGPLAGAYSVSALSTDYGVGTQGYESWNTLSSQLGQMLPRDPINRDGSNSSKYTYQLITDSSGNPRYIYFDPSNCTGSLNGPGLSYRAFIQAAFIDNHVGNFYDDFLSQCGPPYPSYEYLYDRVQMRFIE